MTAPAGERASWLEPLLEALDNAGIGLVITSDGPRGLVWLHDNRSAQRIFGRSSAELRAMPVLTVLSPEENARMSAVRDRLLAGLPIPPFIETVVVRPDGSRVPVELGVTTHRDGDELFAMSFLRDISERRSLQARLLEADRLSTVGALCAGLAHQINNPLTSVMLQLGGLRRSLDRWVPDAAARAHIGDVVSTAMEGADRIGGAVRELMVFADPAIRRRGPVDLREVVEGAARAAGPMVAARARLVTVLEPVALIDGDSPRLGQAVLNLILDAALAFDDDDRERNLVEVRLRGADPWVLVEVADNGRSLGSAGAADPFEPFFPVRGATSTGIGLAVTRTIVEALGGDVMLSPHAGGGAVATIRLPRR